MIFLYAHVKHWVCSCSALGCDMESEGHGLQVARPRKLRQNVIVCEGNFYFSHADLGGK